MDITLSNLINKGERIAVALSGGTDSMALMHKLLKESKIHGFKVIALNVEHGIRGQESINDSNFVKDYCTQNDIPLIRYQVDTLKKAEEEKLSVEQAGRILRYQCFFDAINSDKCDKVATAHHLSDNAESVLFNVLRGTGLKGLGGIAENYSDKIIRPLINTSKSEILDYIKQNNIPYCTDLTNFDDNYTRNFIRLNVMPEIKKIFPEAEKSLNRLSELAIIDDNYISEVASSSIKESEGGYLIPTNLHQAVFNRCIILALNKLGVEKDWEKVHVDSVFNLKNNTTSKQVCLPQDIIAVKEYDNVFIYKSKKDVNGFEHPFSLGKLDVCTGVVEILQVDKSNVCLTSGLFADMDKIPKTAVIRTPRTNDKITKFGGGTKKLCDYLTDKKIPKRKRDCLAILADGDDCLAVIGLAISEKIKVDDLTNKVIQLKLH